MSKRLPKSGKRFLALAFVFNTLGLSGCVTQNFADDEPVVTKDYSDEQLAKTRISLALGYLDMGNTAQAKFNLEKARQFAPELADVYRAFGHYFERVGENEQAEEAYLHALQLAEQDADSLNNFGVFLCRQNRIEEAETYFKRAIRVPTYIRVSETYQNIALCYLKKPHFSKAEEALKRSILHSPNSASSLLQMAQLQYAKQAFAQASDYLSRYELATRRFTAQAIALSFKVHKNLGNDEIADNYATMLLNMFPESNEAKQYLDNELATIDADELATQYKKYTLLKSGAKVNKQPIIIEDKRASNGTVGVEKLQTPNNQGGAQMVIEALPDEQMVVENVAMRPQVEKQAVTTTVTGQVTKQPASSKATVTPVTSPVGAASQPANHKQANQLANSSNHNRSAVVTPVQTSQQPVAKSSAVSRVVPQTSTATQPKDTDVHVVKPGDNLYRISIKYNVTIATLRRWNDLLSENISVGQKIRVKKPK
ncbi:type IV pilus biogenesis/stability protein PilW [Thalassotalea maritima]|uniref:type IV pilus biogenesis/stability protein PilW n=1 Tax=Thalassotalea maritima TaxID=3242416 RepID=UPI003528F0B7